jgi:hypothetical protein
MRGRSLGMYTRGMWQGKSIQQQPTVKWSVVKRIIGSNTYIGGRANEQGSLNTRINLLYLLDSLLEISLPLPLSDAPYPPLISANLSEIVRRVVPEREGVLNVRAAKQVSISIKRNTYLALIPDIGELAD